MGKLFYFSYVKSRPPVAGKCPTAAIWLMMGLRPNACGRSSALAGCRKMPAGWDLAIAGKGNFRMRFFCPTFARLKNHAVT